MAGPRADDRWARRAFASLRYPSYRRFFLGHAISLTGFWMRIAAQGWLVYELTHSEGRLGLVTALGLLPFVLLAPYGGTLADRSDRLGLLVRTQAVAAAVNLALGMAVLLGHVVFWEIAATAVVVGSARAVEIPVRQALVEDLVGAKDRSNAIGLNAAAFQLAQVVGPALVGLIADRFGLGPCFLLVSVASAANVFIVPTLRVEAKARPPARGSTLHQTREGFAFVLGHVRIRTLLLLIAISFLFLFPYRTFLPVLAKDVLGWDTLGYGFLFMVTGVGALLGALWVAGRAHLPATRGVVFGLVWFASLVVAAMGALRTPYAILPGLLAAGFCQVAFVALANTMVQASAPEALRGRVMGIWTLVFGASFPLGSLVMGYVADHVHLTAAFAGGAALTVLATLAVRLRMPRRPTPEPPEVPPTALEGSPPV